MLLPFVLVVVLSVGQLVLVWRAQLLVAQAAREGARIAAVTSDSATIESATTGATRLDPHRMTVRVDRGAPGQTVTVEVRYEPELLPIAGFAARALVVTASATMRVES